LVVIVHEYFHLSQLNFITLIHGKIFINTLTNMKLKEIVEMLLILKLSSLKWKNKLNNPKCYGIEGIR